MDRMKKVLVVFLCSLMLIGCNTPEYYAKIKELEETKDGVRTDLSLKILNEKVICNITALDSLKYLRTQKQIKVMKRLEYNMLLLMEVGQEAYDSIQLTIKNNIIKTPYDSAINVYEKDSMRILGHRIEFEIQIKNPEVNYAIQKYFKVYAVSIDNKSVTVIK